MVKVLSLSPYKQGEACPIKLMLPARGVVMSKDRGERLGRLE